MNKPTDSQAWELIAAAKQASQLAYCPYSKYSVGAAVLTFDGQIYSGCNVENCGYTQTIHAEQSAMDKAISQGALLRAQAQGLTQLEFIQAIAVYAPKGTDPWPCCNCRQSLNEFGLSMWVLGEDGHGGWQTKQLSELIPHAFSMEIVLASVFGKDAAKAKKSSANGGGSHFPQGQQLTDVDNKWRILVDAAKQASQLAYCPYSHYPVGAAVLSFDGKIYTGCNVENCSYTQTIHAEQVAMANAISEGSLKRAIGAGLTQFDFIEAVAVYSPKTAEPWPSCNGRQSLNEFGLNIDIIGESASGDIIRKKLGELIPFAFPMDAVLASIAED